MLSELSNRLHPPTPITLHKSLKFNKTKTITIPAMAITTDMNLTTQSMMTKSTAMLVSCGLPSDDEREIFHRFLNSQIILISLTTNKSRLHHQLTDHQQHKRRKHLRQSLKLNRPLT